MVKIILLLALLIFAAALILNILSTLLKECTWFCNVLEMHHEPSIQTLVRGLHRGVCPRCNKKVKRYLAYGAVWITDIEMENKK